LSDALSTAFMVMEKDEIAALCARYGDVEALEMAL
jgi:thiamine biosynthesis lipoprotein ApbE